MRTREMERNDGKRSDWVRRYEIKTAHEREYKIKRETGTHIDTQMDRKREIAIWIVIKSKYIYTEKEKEIQTVKEQRKK